MKMKESMNEFWRNREIGRGKRSKGKGVQGGGQVRDWRLHKTSWRQNLRA